MCFVRDTKVTRKGQIRLQNYQIFEVVREDLNGDQSLLQSMKIWTRFHCRGRKIGLKYSLCKDRQTGRYQIHKWVRTARNCENWRQNKLGLSCAKLRANLVIYLNAIYLIKLIKQLIKLNKVIKLIKSLINSIKWLIDLMVKLSMWSIKLIKQLIKLKKWLIKLFKWLIKLIKWLIKMIKWLIKMVKWLIKSSKWLIRLI